MNENEKTIDGKKWLIDKIDYILQIHLEKLKSEKLAIATQREIYLTMIRNIRTRTFTSVGFVATLLLALAAFKFFDQVQGLHLIISIIFVLDLAIGALAYAIFANHLGLSHKHWFEIEDAYNTIISCK